MLLQSPLLFLLGLSLFGSILCMAQSPLDTTFADLGMRRIDLVSRDQAIKIALQNDQQAVVLASIATVTTGGILNTDAVLLRLNLDGTIDSTFGISNGISSFDFSDFQLSEPKDMAITPDQKIWVLGQGHWTDSLEYQPFCLRQFLPNGVPDTTFGNNSELLFNFLGGTEAPARICQQADGKVLVCGYTLTNTGEHQDELAIARIAPNGTLDTTFGGTGKIVFSFAANTFFYPNRLAQLPDRHGYGGFLSDIVVKPNNKILCIGGFNNGVNYLGFIMQLLPNGMIDSSFAINGMRAINIDDGNNHHLNRIVLQDDGSMIVGVVIDSQNMSRDCYMATLDSLCQTINLNDSYDFYNNFDFTQDIVLQPDHKIWCIGRSIKPMNYQSGYLSDYFGVTRVMPNFMGIDTGFGDNGKYLFAADTTRQNVPTNMLITPDQKVLLLGTVYNPTSNNRSDIMVLRLNNSFETLSMLPFVEEDLGGLYPNPTTDYLLTTASNWTRVNIYDVNGRLLLEQDVSPNSTRISLADLPSGMLVVCLQDSNGVRVHKILKK